MPYTVSDASIEKRPDAIGLDYLTSFSLGPVNTSDPSEGLLDYTWRCRVDGHDFYLTRENVAGDGWEAEILLFSADPADGNIQEIDLAFTQNATPVVGVQRNDNEIWIYFYDATVPGNVFRNLGVGRNPRALLDDPTNVQESDVIIAYISDVKGLFVYREQRDRYATEQDTTFAVTTNDFLQELVRGEDRRIHLVYSEQNEETGRYTILTHSSSLYPVILDPEGAEPDLAVVSLGLTDLVLTGDMDAESLEPDLSINALTLNEIVLTNDLQEALEPDLAINTLGLTDVVLTNDLQEAMEPDLSIVSFVLDGIVITNDMIESMEPSLDIVSLTLSVP